MTPDDLIAAFWAGWDWLGAALLHIADGIESAIWRWWP